VAERATRRRPGHTPLFVYGSLLSGLHNHPLLAGSRLIGSDRTRPAFTLVDLGAFPALVAGGNTAVVGEVWEVDAATLARLDRLEGHPRWYRRTPIRLASRRHAETYLMAASQVDGRILITGGDWRAYRALGGLTRDMPATARPATRSFLAEAGVHHARTRARSGSGRAT
jgi:gamma-glutamylaminecyclotransferase